MSKLLRSFRKDVVESHSPLGFENTGGGSWPVWHRYLTIDGKRAYELGNVCSTCAFFFERMDGANTKVEVEELVTRLADGVGASDDDAIALLSGMVPSGAYIVNLVELKPSEVVIGTANDYFVNERQAIWGIDGFWGMPHNPKVPYYRAGDRAIDESARLFEFVIPMYPRTWLDAQRVQLYCSSLEKGLKPTAVSVSLLDVKEPAMFSEAAVGTQSSHWCLAHYLLDGHHKLEAAALVHSPITLLSFLAISQGVSSPEEAARISELLDFC